ncbi:uncharacterized protein LOC110451738 [Mizuhopecten yessoensis]|uniref:BTB/POZ domain-containing protein KCTD7 n=1 Tax=Mizuhopecten yessoensis TaxID=6573 RepID=A0A210QLC4_MIZYE|nr:uncharacterized protein LOC110451738 [Mizuhopecten yessoensis]OWF49548.1 BTB/POZ domain-containing protein KCTD7 [Mizuhopecten yessoensis]
MPESSLQLSASSSAISCTSNGLGSSHSAGSSSQGGTAVYRNNTGEKKSKMATSQPPPVSSSTDLMTQRAILEQIFLKRAEEGDFWYVIVAEWLEQLKRYLGVPSNRKYYHQRSYPGPIITRRDYAHTVDVVHEDAWRMLIQWYGLADGHKPIKLVVYGYNRSPDIEHNINAFKLMLSNSPPEDFHNEKFSKMEKVGHVEWKARTLYGVEPDKKTRLWGKPDADGEWRALTCRDKAIGKCLDIDSDFIRPIIAMEICGCDDIWGQTPEGVEPSQDPSVGPLYEQDIFDDVTSTWEIDIHDQIDHIGKSVIDGLHMNFSAFVQRAKEFIDQRDAQLRQREREITHCENFSDDTRRRLEEKEQTLDVELASCQALAKDYDMKKIELASEHDQKLQELEELEQRRKTDYLKEREKFDIERKRFNEELERITEMNEIQEGRIKLDIGGVQYTTSLATLKKDSGSMLAAMFSGRHQLRTEADGSYFIDRDGAHFRYILNYLRDGGIKDGTLPSNENLWRELLTEAEYYQISGLVDYLYSLLYKQSELFSVEAKDEPEDEEEGNDTFV